jgi:dihydroxy-acid dehydratase
MSYSLQSREIIADSIETVMSGQWYDANISIPGCDKNMPGCMIAIARVNRPALMVYGGSIRAGKSCLGKPLDIVSAFQSYGEFISGKITYDRQTNTCKAGISLSRLNAIHAKCLLPNTNIFDNYKNHIRNANKKVKKNE